MGQYCRRGCSRLAERLERRQRVGHVVARGVFSRKWRYYIPLSFRDRPFDLGLICTASLVISALSIGSRGSLREIISCTEINSV